MSIESDTELLQAQWTEENFGQYEGKWIAFREGVRMVHEDLDKLLREYENDILESRAPIFAYVTFEAIA